MSPQTSQFDDIRYREINEKRKQILDDLLHKVLPTVGLRTAVDVGCGIGFFSHYLWTLGLQVQAFDGRPENVQVAQERYPAIHFGLWNAEDRVTMPAGQFDLVLCFGLLNHLENPFRVIRNLKAITEKVLVIESVITESRLPMATLVDEIEHGEAQALTYLSFILTESALAKMLYATGFKHVTKIVNLPDHEEFLTGPWRRIVSVASDMKIDSPFLNEIPEPFYRIPDVAE